MKILLSSIVILLIVQTSSATTLFQQLCTFNYNWENYESRVPEKKAKNFKSETEYIQEHLKNVLVILRTNPVDQFSSRQLASRHILMKVLSDYRSEGRFPVNYYHEERIPVFIDEHQTHCAVGFLMQQTGDEALAVATARNDNYIWVKDIKDPKVIAWQKKSGFTLEELKLIQGAYDFYMERAFTAPNKYEIPQKPEVKTAYFEDELTEKELKHKEKNVWFLGEGKNQVLHGKWIQNYAIGMPWIEGYFIHGKRSGQWKEYYQGTTILCRTENWQNDKLNGIRRRFDRNSGEIVEEILFKNGVAVTKTNLDQSRGIKWIRKPLDSVSVYTEAYTLEGALLASGKEKVFNPGNLLWFQNIELTALNSAAITAREASIQQSDLSPFHRRANLYNSPPLVEYKKDGDWIFYRNSIQSTIQYTEPTTLSNRLSLDFRIFGPELYTQIHTMGEVPLQNGYDSIVAKYENNSIHDFYGYGTTDFTHIKLNYYEVNNLVKIVEINPYYLGSSGYQRSNDFGFPRRIANPVLKEIGQYNQQGLRIGTWKHFNTQRQLFKTEEYILPSKDETASNEN
ncbi:MAG: hypothetical protein WC044_00435 [Crocinitomicaceae bacterium]